MTPISFEREEMAYNQTLGIKTTIQQVNTMLATSKNVVFPG